MITSIVRKIGFSLSIISLLVAHSAFAQSVTDTVDATYSGCTKLTINMTIGAKDSATSGQVSDLQFYLSGAGYLKSDPTGYFGLMTQQAVKDFQKANGITPNGAVGPITRGKINGLSCDVKAGITTTATTTCPVTAVICSDGKTIPPMGANCSPMMDKCPTVPTSPAQTNAVNPATQSTGSVTGSPSTTGTSGGPAITLMFSGVDGNGKAVSVTNGQTLTGVDPTSLRIWKWSSTGASSVTASNVVSGDNCGAGNYTTDQWEPWVGKSIAGTRFSGSNSSIIGSAYFGCTIEATYSARNTSGGLSTATVKVVFLANQSLVRNSNSPTYYACNGVLSSTPCTTGSQTTTGTTASGQTATEQALVGSNITCSYRSPSSGLTMYAVAGAPACTYENFGTKSQDLHGSEIVCGCSLTCNGGVVSSLSNSCAKPTSGAYWTQANTSSRPMRVDLGTSNTAQTTTSNTVPFTGFCISPAPCSQATFGSARYAWTTEHTYGSFSTMGEAFVGDTVRQVKITSLPSCTSANNGQVITLGNNGTNNVYALCANVSSTVDEITYPDALYRPAQPGGARGSTVNFKASLGSTTQSGCSGSLCSASLPPMAVIGSNSSSGPWTENPSLCNDSNSAIYVRVTNANKNSNPKGCSFTAGQSVNGAGCSNLSAYREFGSGEWVDQSTIQSVPMGGALANGQYESFISTGSGYQKVGTFTLKQCSSSTTSGSSSGTSGNTTNTTTQAPATPTCGADQILVGGSCQAYCTGDSILSADGKSCVIPTCSVTLTRVTQSGSPSTGGNTIVEKVLTTLLSSNSYTIEKLKATFENVTNLQYSFNRLAFKDWKASNGLNDFPNGSETYTSGTDSTYVFRGVSKNGSTTKTVLCSPDTVIIKAPPETAPYDNTAPGGGNAGPGGM